MTTDDRLSNVFTMLSLENWIWLSTMFIYLFKLLIEQPTIRHVWSHERTQRSQFLTHQSVFPSRNAIGVPCFSGLSSPHLWFRFEDLRSGKKSASTHPPLSTELYGGSSIFSEWSSQLSLEWRVSPSGELENKTPSPVFLWKWKRSRVVVSAVFTKEVADFPTLRTLLSWQHLPTIGRMRSTHSSPSLEISMCLFINFMCCCFVVINTLLSHPSAIGCLVMFSLLSFRVSCCCWVLVLFQMYFKRFKKGRWKGFLLKQTKMVA